MNPKQLTTTASKTEEIEMLNTMKTMAGEGTYLSSIFSQKFMAWVVSQIKNDSPADIMDVVDNIEKNSDAQQSKITELTQWVATVEQDLKNSNEKSKRFESTSKNRLEQFKDACEALNNKCNENYNMQIELNNAKEEIKTLKAKLYDLITK